MWLPRPLWPPRFGRPIGRQGLGGYLPPGAGGHIATPTLGGHLPPREGSREAAAPSGWAPPPVYQRPCLASGPAGLAGHSSPRGRSGYFPAMAVMVIFRRGEVLSFA
ncbi:hypothetical protein KSP39_PZI021061 [Platanthera zijinensis]|uniref:Uncharacterized protein n=1 Tax=Platanthera zijinensis TaxID=2320716 RepID=A0AAP0AY10_9ASPA